MQLKIKRLSIFGILTQKLKDFLFIEISHQLKCINIDYNQIRILQQTLYNKLQTLYNNIQTNKLQTLYNNV